LDSNESERFRGLVKNNQIYRLLRRRMASTAPIKIKPMPAGSGVF
jgi:hypothetical protein